MYKIPIQRSLWAKPDCIRQLLSLLLLFTLASPLLAQPSTPCDHEVKGTVLDAETKEAVPYVQVSIKGTQRAALTDINGAFQITDLCDPSQVLVISCLGYRDTICQLHHEHSDGHSLYLEKEVNALETVTITAERSREEGTISISQQSISKEVLSSNPTQSLASALSAINGVTFISTGNNVERPVIHGLYGNRVLILNNGIKHGFQNWGTGHAPEIDVATANRVTVIKGAAGVRFGPEALGGAIIVDANPLLFAKPFNAQVGTGYQTNGRGYFANAKIAEGRKKWSYHLGAGYTRIGDRQAPDYYLTNTGKEEKSINGGLRHRMDDVDIKVYYSYLSQNLGILRSSIAESGTAVIRAFNAEAPIIIKPFSYDINAPNQLVKHHLGKVEASWWYSDNARLTLRLGTQFNNRKEFDVRRNIDSPIINLDLITNDFQLEWKHPKWMALDGLVGVQIFTQNSDNNPGTQTTPFIPNYNTFRTSAFFIENLRMNKSSFELGLRLDHEYNSARGRETSQDVFRDEYRFLNLTASLGYIRQFSANTTFRTNLATAWRTPNIAELYSFGQRSFRTSFGLLRYYVDENSALRTNRVLTLKESETTPERGYKWVNEWRTQKTTNILTLTAYAHYIENFIFERPLAVIGTIRGPMPVFIYDQANAAFLGADISWQKEWSKTVNGTLGMSYLWSKNLEKGEPLINQPPININYELGWKMPALWEAVSAHIVLQPSYTFEQFQAPRTVTPEQLIDGTVVVSPDSEIFDFKEAPKGFFLFDLALRIKADKFDAGLSVQNVFNTRYRSYLNQMRYFADEPGINFLFSINYNFNTKSN